MQAYSSSGRHDAVPVGLLFLRVAAVAEVVRLARVEVRALAGECGGVKDGVGDCVGMCSLGAPSAFSL